ncbi:hypothetical protein E6C27_scaffold979G00550 [Cucumis melo var. makuwa]|uniref:Ty3-gypsy retrotransposon protein n=1 Tax=Cucumis melo var. makuwa TaxID=1194695 RepID=A0A5A7VLL5_CUCMM|nr:hypothetical protein E6C27_scaffold979G00550 [Cucumis melo var. makuwa]
MALLFSLEGSSELTLEFSGLAVDLVGDSFLSLGKGFPTTGPRVQVETVVIHRGLHVSDCTEYLFYVMDLKVTVQYVVKHWSGCGSWNLDGDGHTRLICASFGSTRLICAFYGTTRLLCRGTARGRKDA